ncbi:hypothetical protein ACFTWF_38105 [Rhodococcus sp. NPDC056960]|uniref:hypothetical protein n=1 Tax=Rhodococcus sp. NPDC056960 TaxID=3345982 RepID=UPI0036351E43
MFAELLCEEIDTVARHLEEAEILGYHARTHHKSARPARLGAEIATLRVELTAAGRLLEAIVFRFPEAIADDGSAPRRTTRDWIDVPRCTYHRLLAE